MAVAAPSERASWSTCTGCNDVGIVHSYVLVWPFVSFLSFFFFSFNSNAEVVAASSKTFSRSFSALSYFSLRLSKNNEKRFDY